ncbi:MAG: UDP-N-acetylmuramate dehydrogenase [Bdellovibrionaceae bacterium]|jgi:UDP-N-acetylmuramate dehydrogenase|nr:UDP-N-acetylmuramate dehydrogenase [Pseudobdellovibrionaceae bacterium]
MLDVIEKGILLAAKTSWKVGGAAEYFVEPSNVQDLAEALSWAQSENISVTVLGDGTNVLVSDQGIKGLVVLMKSFQQIESVEEKAGRLEIVSQSGVAKSKLMREFLKRKLSPALFLSGLPGNLGGGIFMNAGVGEDREPKEFCEIIDWFEVLGYRDLQVKKYNNKDVIWNYRKCSGYDEGIIIRAQISWPMDAQDDIPAQVIAANKLRLSKQPLDLPSCGSVFKNPDGTSAGKLIDECGLKGLTKGGAQVSTKHANFIVNTNQAKASEIYALIQEVQKEVLKQKNIHLKTEVRMLGWD